MIRITLFSLGFCLVSSTSFAANDTPNTEDNLRKCEIVVLSTTQESYEFEEALNYIVSSPDDPHYPTKNIRFADYRVIGDSVTATLGVGAEVSDAAMAYLVTGMKKMSPLPGFDWECRHSL